MRVKRVAIKNFRAAEDVEIDLSNQTAILGGNGCGKSTILRAMDRFFGQQTSMEADDFFARDLTRVIEIELTFHQFSDAEAELFFSRIHNQEMTVTRVFEAGGGRSNGAYYGSTLKHAAFDQIRQTDGAVEKRAAYNVLRGSSEDYANLPQVQRVDQVLQALLEWEEANPDQCALGRDDGRFFGFTNVAKGALQKGANFVFIPAVRDAAADSLDSRGAVIARLMELVVKSAIQRREDVKSFQARVTEEFRALTDPAKLPELGELSGALSNTLKLFYTEASVALEWKPPEEFQIPLPSTDVYLDDDGFKGPVDRKGHGLQRAFIVTLLQHLAQASAEIARQADPDASQQPAEEAAEAQQPDFVPSLILAIEEPELYQHPTKQRHLARVLTQLSRGLIPGVATSTQIIFASHSALFVSMDRFDEIRIARRCDSESGPVKTCRVQSARLSEIARRLEAANGVAANTFTDESLRARLHILGPELAEGFFANVVVLVEGVTDKAAIIAACEEVGVDLEAKGVAVLSVGGKYNIDRPALIFQEFGVPVYAIWDCDSGKPVPERGTSCNRMLQALFGSQDAQVSDATTVVSQRFACFDDKLETTIRGEIGEALFDELLDQLKGEYGVAKHKDAMKTPVIVAEIFRRARVRGATSNTIGRIVDEVVRMRGGGV